MNTNNEFVALWDEWEPWVPSTIIEHFYVDKSVLNILIVFSKTTNRLQLISVGLSDIFCKFKGQFDPEGKGHKFFK